MSNILDRLNKIRMGYLTEDDQYDLPDDTEQEEEEQTSEEETESQEPEQEETQEDEESSEEESESEGDEDEPETSDQDDDSSYDLDEEDTEDTGSDDSMEDENQAQPVDANKTVAKPGEILKLDPVSRSILNYRNFSKYRELRDDVSEMIHNLAEMPSTSDGQRKIIRLCIEKGSDLLEKLNDYILHRYKDNSYDKNYRTYMDFVLEKRLIDNIFEQLNSLDEQ